jgi:hypothetical protein
MILVLLAVTDEIDVCLMVEIGSLRWCPEAPTYVFDHEIVMLTPWRCRLSMR